MNVDARNIVGQVVESVSDADRAWLGVLTALALYGGKKVIDAVLPRGSSFRFMERYMRRDNRRRRERE